MDDKNKAMDREHQVAAEILEILDREYDLIDDVGKASKVIEIVVGNLLASATIMMNRAAKAMMEGRDEV